MELFGESTTSSCFPAARKKRSDSCRRPHPNPKPIIHYQYDSTLQYSARHHGRHEEISKMESDCKPCVLALPDLTKFDVNKRVGPSNQVLVSEHPGSEKKLKKLKLKIGGVTRTLHSKSSAELSAGCSVDVSSVHDALEKQTQISSMEQNYKFDVVHKSSKKRAIDDGLDEEDDEEIRYLKRLRASKVAYDKGGRKTKGIAKLMAVTDHGASVLGKDGRKKMKINEDEDFEMEMISDDDLRSNCNRIEDDFVDLDPASGQEMTMTTRQRALECPDSGGVIEFPNGLPDAPSKKQKLSVVEQQLRKSEAAQRRRLQAEQAAKEAEAEAIRKILGQDSNRKKKEEKLKKRQEDLAQERNSKLALEPNTVRFFMGPRGTVVTFSEDLGLPKMFDSLPCSYPPPREKCVGPNCTNEYKYRDSKSKLPLCSLNCYRAVQGNTGLLPAC